MTLTGFSGVARANWLVSTPRPQPQCFSQDPPRAPSQGARAGRPEAWVLREVWGEVGMVRWGRSDPRSSPHPPSAVKVRDSWREDALFGYQFLNGANPMLLRRSEQLPARLMFPPGMEELKVQLETELQVQTRAP